MTKQTGLGMNGYVGGYDLSGDVTALGRIAAPLATLDVTAINKAAFERIAGLRDGAIDFTAWFNPSAGQEHAALSPLPTTDQLVTAAIPTTGTSPAIGDPAACLLAKQVNYDPNRGNDGSLSFAVSAMGNAYGLEWGELLTAGVRTDTTATNGASRDQTTVSTAFGWQAYLHSFALTGTSCTVTLQDSADNAAWANLSGAAFTAFTGRGQQRLAAPGATDTVRRYVRAITSGTFTSASFAVVFVRNAQAVTF